MSKNYLTMLAQKPTEEADNLDNNNNTNNGDATFSSEHMQSIIDVVIKGEYLVDDVDDDVEDQSNASSPSSASSSSSSSTSANPSTMLPPPTPQTPELYSSPTFSDIHDFNTYSPDTDFLNTPLFEDCGDDMDMGMLTGMYDGTEHGDLFPPLEGFSTSSSLLSSMYEKTPQANTIPQLPEGLLTLTPESPMLHDFSPSTVNPSSLYPTPSPRVPATLDLSSAFASPSTGPLHDFLVAPVIPTPTAPAPTSAPRRRSTATGTRKGVTPNALVPVDAPTQPRKYVLPSSTSRKELPTIFAKKRSRSVAFSSHPDDDPDADDDEADREPPPGPNATEKEQIEYKRRQNTVAARRSRKRKLEYQQGLERDVGKLRREKEHWRVMAEVYRGMLLERGVKVPVFEDMDLEGEDGE
ncbi:hypothetical protein H0H93_007659 [Arthromyces matolae]|nr:hypothetical protein H0H93_007659 [Arthromyces matolae]